MYFQAEELDDFYQDYRVVGYEGFEEAELDSGKKRLAVLGDWIEENELFDPFGETSE